MQVGGSGANVGMAEPEGDDRGVNAVLQQVHGAGVPQDVRMDPLRREGVVAAEGGPCVFGDDPFDSVGAEPASRPGREQRLVSSTASFGDPGAEQAGGGGVVCLTVAMVLIPPSWGDCYISLQYHGPFSFEEFLHTFSHTTSTLRVTTLPIDGRSEGNRWRRGRSVSNRSAGTAAISVCS